MIALGIPGAGIKPYNPEGIKCRHTGIFITYDKFVGIRIRQFRVSISFDGIEIFTGILYVRLCHVEF